VAAAQVTTVTVRTGPASQAGARLWMLSPAREHQSDKNYQTHRGETAQKFTDFGVMILTGGYR